jgi:hypothetical protein
VSLDPNGVYCPLAMRPRRLKRTPRTILVHALLALSLLVAQSLAQAHVYSHLRNGTPTTDLGGAAGQLCSECLSGATLLGTAGSPDVPRVSLSPAVVTCEDRVLLVHVEISRHYAFRARAPPATF